MHYYQLHIGDWIKDTSHLTLQEEAIYHRLLMVYYNKERPFPDDLKMISRAIRARGDEDIISDLLEEFFYKKGKKWYNKRAELELKKYKEKSEKAQKSAKARWNKDLESCERIANAKQTQSERNANHKPITINQEPLLYTAAMPCKDGEFIPLDSQMKSWNESYPDIDIDKEINKAKSWLLSNPNKQKTVRGCPRFINAWLSRAKPEVLNATHEQDFIQLHTDSSWAEGLN